MKTTISKENISKSRILLLTLSVFIVSVAFFTSCSDAEGISGTADTALIEKIESATKTAIEVTSLPSATANAFNDDLSDSFIESVALAQGLGFKVAIITDNVAREENKSDVFFSIEGRQLKDDRAKFKKRRHKCFEFVFPIDFLMPDTTTITLTEKADWILIKEWYETNPDLKERAEIVFPLNISLEDGTVQTLLEVAELKEVKNSCRINKDKRKCFSLVLPISFTMPDETMITVAKKTDFKLLRDWHKANTNVKEKGALNYPVDIRYKDDETATVNDATEMQAAKQACK
jgi:hypothetical protein